MLAEKAYLFTPQIAALPVAGATSRFPVRRLYCVGRNYVSHIREMKEGDERDPPFFFQKPADALVFDGGTVPYPPATTDFQYEVELVVAIGTAGAFIAVDDALNHVYGYAIGIDMTRRDLQREARERQLPWEPGKSFDHSAPCGPLFPKKDVGDIASSAISLSVNGIPHQQADLKQMIWNVPEIIANLSKQYRLEPGDLIFTGTPAGVGPVEVNDRIEATIGGLGSLSITITSKEV
ncbi:MAG TPA: fumarylacetoacetate hydrolase family protein [Methylovirgula sp.]